MDPGARSRDCVPEEPQATKASFYPLAMDGVPANDPIQIPYAMVCFMWAGALCPQITQC